MTKSFVTMEQHVCEVCGRQFDTGSLLFDQRLREKFDMHTVTGRGLCPEDQKLFDEGWLALVAADPTKSKISGDKLKQEDAYRTGDIMHIKREAAQGIFNVPIPEDIPMLFVQPEVIQILKERVAESSEGDGQ